MSASNGHPHPNPKAELEKSIVVYLDTTAIAQALERGLDRMTDQICLEYRTLIRVIEKFTKQGKEEWE
jgi:hypothetical protein